MFFFFLLLLLVVKKVLCGAKLTHTGYSVMTSVDSLFFFVV